MAEIIVVDDLEDEEIRGINWRMIDRTNPFNLRDDIFRSRFRLSKEAVRAFTEDMRQTLHAQPNGYSTEMQVLTALRLLGSGSYQTVIGDTILTQMAQSSVSRILDSFLTAVMSVARNYISFPVSAADVTAVRRDFFQKYGFPNLLGAIDCSHMLIEKPRVPDWPSFLNRKNKFSIYVQMVCDSQMRILDVVARWPGSSHDSLIWSLSSLRTRFQTVNELEGCYLLGDSGYPLELCLLTPYVDPVGAHEEIFNRKHHKTRNAIERCFGVLKGRFRILHESGGGTLLYSPEKVCKLIIAAAVLHNVCVQFNVEYDGDDVESDDDDDDSYQDTSGLNEAAVALRNEIAMYFQMNA